MNPNTVRIFMAILGGVAGTFFTAFGQACTRAYSRAFTEEALRGKFALGFMLGLGWSIRLLFWGHTTCWLCVGLSPIAGLIAGGLLLTAAHFLGEIIWIALTDIWSYGKTFAQSFIVQTEAVV